MLVAGADNVEDFTNLLQQLADDAADVRTSIPDIGADDSIAVRKGINNYLRNALDTIRKTRKNVTNNSSSLVESDD